ncbi:MAG: hypothetical protein HY843_04015 [Bdellovibrio sp.]|nr:hypothetical protein [Bdellovibrio sp.]
MHSKISIRYQWQAGDFLTRFFEGLKKEILLASVCPKCRRKNLPPKRICVRCFQTTQELVPVNNSGRLISFTQINLSSARPSLSPSLTKVA